MKFDAGKIVRKQTMRKQDHLIWDPANPCVIRFPILQEQRWLRHGFSTRLGGVSTGFCESMNLGFSKDNDPDHVRENFRRMGEAIGFEPRRMVFTDQTHTNHIREAAEEDAGKGFVYKKDYRDVDGLITKTPNLVLVTFFADCVPLFAADPVHHVIGSAHSGWRGTCADIGGELVRKMEKTYGSRPEDLIAAIGPCICADCYEVGPDTVEEFRAVRTAEEFDQIVRPNERGRWQLDLVRACVQNFLRSGMKPENVSVPDLCTRCNPELLFSHRATAGKRGSLAGFLMIAEE